MKPGRLRRFLFVSVPALVVSALVMAVLIEGWVRFTWDPKRGSPGFFVTDATRGQRLGANYDGWFAGVPVKTNALGFRATRDFDLKKGPKTFRILVLGDSVTFGHGAVHDYPSLLQGLLEKARPDVEWQVWNLGVPGYNTSQELAHLLEVGPAYHPDLVIVGFFINDIIGNVPVPHRGVAARAAAGGLAFLQQHWYSFELYKRIILTAAWRLSGTAASRSRFESLESEEQATIHLDALAESSKQQITPFDQLSEAAAAAQQCTEGMRPSAKDLADMEAQPDWPAFLDAVHGFQKLNREGAYKIVFFLNLIPPACSGDDFFYDGKSIEHAFFLKLFSDAAPTVSAYPAFLRVKPSQMPLAEAHAIGNANELKAEILFQFLQSTGRLAPSAQ